MPDLRGLHKAIRMDVDMKFEAAIFDLDGTLINSMGIWEKIDADFLKKRGFEVPPDYIEAICACRFREAAEYTIHRFALPDSVDALIEEWNGMALHEYSHNIPLKPYAREYLLKLQSSGVRLAVATSLPAALYEPVLKNNHIYDFFDIICSVDEVERGKEFPDLFLYAASKLGVSNENCLVFEDILQAVCSAKQAGMTVYGVYDDSSRDHWEEIGKAADGILYDFQNAPLPE